MIPQMKIGSKVKEGQAVVRGAGKKGCWSPTSLNKNLRHK